MIARRDSRNSARKRRLVEVEHHRECAARLEAAGALKELFLEPELSRCTHGRGDGVVNEMPYRCGDNEITEPCAVCANGVECRCCQGPSFMSRGGTVGLYADDVSLHPAERREQLRLLLLTYIVLVETLRQVFHERIEFGIGDLHACVRIPHALARVGAWTTGCLAYLVDEHLLETWNVGPSEARVDALVGRNVGNEVVDHDGDCLFPTKAIVERACGDGRSIGRGGSRGGGGGVGSLLLVSARRKHESRQGKGGYRK